MKKPIGFRIDPKVWEAVQYAGVKDVAKKVEEFLRMLAQAGLDGQSSALKELRFKNEK